MQVEIYTVGLKDLSLTNDDKYIVQNLITISEFLKTLGMNARLPTID